MSAQPKARAVTARYDTRGAGDPPNGLARLTPRQATRTAVGLMPDPKTGRLVQHVRQAPATRVGAVQDPTDPKQQARIAVKVNTHTDLIENEYAHGRISTAAYRTARLVMGVFERSHGLRRAAPTYEPKDRGDVAFGVEAQIVRGLDQAAEIQQWLVRIEKSVGRIGMRMLRRVLDDGASFKDIAAERGRGTSERAVSQTASQVRQLLEDLSEDLSKDGGRR